MPSYHLIATHHNDDGSWETPFVDIVLTARNATAAVEAATHYPLDVYVEKRPSAWLTDETGAVIWTGDLDLPQAA